MIDASLSVDCDILVPHFQFHILVPHIDDVLLVVIAADTTVKTSNRRVYSFQNTVVKDHITICHELSVSDTALEDNFRKMIGSTDRGS